jgi:hypothetical protein
MARGKGTAEAMGSPGRSTGLRVSLHLRLLLMLTASLKQGRLRRLLLMSITSLKRLLSLLLLMLIASLKQGWLRLLLLRHRRVKPPRLRMLMQSQLLNQKSLQGMSSLFLL